MDSLVRDLTLAARMLRRRSGFAALAIAVLTLAIGANSAIFSVVEGVLLREPAFEEPGRLVFLWERNTIRGRDRNVVGPFNFTRWRDRAQSFSDMAGFASFQANLTGGGQNPQRLDSGVTTGNLFAVLGARALLGRTLQDADSKAGAPEVTVLSEGLWRSRFSGDPSVLGTSVTLDGKPTVVVGVMPKSFQVPPAADLWQPILVDEEFRNSRGRWMQVVGRLKDGVTLAQARDEMRRVSEALVPERPDSNTGWSSSVYLLHADLVRKVKPAIGVLMGAVALLLLVACANVANLLLARALSREREIALRCALGAGPGRILKQLLTESLLLAVAGGASGLLLGWVALQGLVTLLPAEVLAITTVSLNAKAVVFTAFVSLGAAVLFGLVPALQQSRPSLVGAMKQGGAVRGASSRERGLKATLVVAEIALSLVLTAGAGLLLRSFWNLSHENPGFRAEGVLSVPLDLPQSSYAEPAKQAALFKSAVERVAALPGVEAAGAISWAPMGMGAATDFRLLDRPAPPVGEEVGGDIRMVTPGLFRAMDIPLLAGRDFTAADTQGRPKVVIINEAMAREFWPHESALGKQIGMEWGEDHIAEVVGVVGDVRLRKLDEAARSTLYWPEDQLTNSFMTLMVRTKGQPEALAGAVRAQIAALDPELPPGPMRPLNQIVEGSIEQERFLLQLLGAFALLALCLAAVGVYGVMAFAVTERVPEFGVRLAVGATPGDVMRLLLRDGLRLGAMGIGVGVAVALLAGGLLESQLYEVTPQDPLALASVAGLLLVSVLMAAAVPAWRAGRLDPVKALRSE